MPLHATAAALLALGDELARAVTPGDVFFSLTRHAPSITGATNVIVFRRDPAGADRQVAFTPVCGSDVVSGFSAVWPIGASGAVRRGDVANSAGAYRDLFRVLPASVAMLAHAPVGPEHVLVLGWASEASLDDEAWRVVEGAARQTGSALERVDALRRVRELALKDPETGLGNRRLVEIVLQHSFAQAARGAPLSVVSIRPPARGAGAAAAARLAETLKVQARDSDVVAHFSEGIYVVLLHASSAEGAGVFLRRVLSGMEDPGFSIAVAEHDGRFDTPEALLENVLTQVSVSPQMN